MLRSTPFHRENYSQLIVGVTHQFYQCCLERFRGERQVLLFLALFLPPLKPRVFADLAGSESPESATVRSAQDLQLGSLRTAAVWVDSPELHACLIELKNALVSLPTIARYQHQD